MAAREIRRILGSLSVKHPCLVAKVVHRVGVIPVGDTAIYVGLGATHRSEAIELLTEFMNRLKQDVPIWKAHALTGVSSERSKKSALSPSAGNAKTALLSLDEALVKIQEHTQPLLGVCTIN